MDARPERLTLERLCGKSVMSHPGVLDRVPAQDAKQHQHHKAQASSRIGPLYESFHFAMDYDLWVRIAALSPIAYQPRKWAEFRLHAVGKTTAEDDRCWPEMIKVHRRLGGGPLAQIYLRWAARRVIGPLWLHRLRWQSRRGNSPSS